MAFGQKNPSADCPWRITAGGIQFLGRNDGPREDASPNPVRHVHPSGTTVPPQRGGIPKPRVSGAAAPPWVGGTIHHRCPTGNHKSCLWTSLRRQRVLSRDCRTPSGCRMWGWTYPGCAAHAATMGFGVPFALQWKLKPGAVASLALASLKGSLIDSDLLPGCRSAGLRPFVRMESDWCGRSHYP